MFATELKHGGIPVEDFARHVKVLHLDGDYKFNQEFEVTTVLFYLFIYFLYLTFSQRLLTRLFNPLIPYSDENEISLCTVTTCSNLQMIKEMNTEDKMS